MTNDRASLMDRVVEKWADIVNRTREHWRWLGRLLSIVATLYLVALLGYTLLQVNSIQWQAYWLPGVYSLFFFLFSLLVQYFAWLRLLPVDYISGWHDAVIYFRALVLRRLPGGAWHWVGRVAMYSEAAQIPAKTVMLANFMEWILLLFVAAAFILLGWTVLPFWLRCVLAMIVLAGAIALLTAWQPALRSTGQRIINAVIILAYYAFAWFQGGLIVYVFANAINAHSVSVWFATWVWAVAGGFSMLLVPIPTGLGIRELGLTFLLQPALPAAGALMVAVLNRILFVVADFLWGALGLGVSILFQKKSDPGRE